MIENRKGEGRVCSTFYDPFFRDSLTPTKNRLMAFPKKAKSVLGFKPSSLGNTPLLYHLRHCLFLLKTKV